MFLPPIQFSWIPDFYTGQGGATLYFDNFTKHPAYYGVIEALTNETYVQQKQRRVDGKSKPLFE